MLRFDASTRAMARQAMQEGTLVRGAETVLVTEAPTVARPRRTLLAWGASGAAAILGVLGAELVMLGRARSSNARRRRLRRTAFRAAAIGGGLFALFGAAGVVHRVRAKLRLTSRCAQPTARQAVERM
jgi:hypothetical protein